MAPAVHELVLQSHRFDDPLLPHIPSFFKGLRCEDHATYVTSERDEDKFRAYWKDRGLRAVEPLMPTNYPARHIAFLADPGEYATCEDMVGLSVSYDPQSPINKSIHLYGGRRIDEHGEIAPGRLQHIAYAADPEIGFAGLRRSMERNDCHFMTPILEFEDDNRATLRQMFIACVVPYGPFVEIVQRGLGDDGKPFTGFSAEQIDVLYAHYDAYSRGLL